MSLEEWFGATSGFGMNGAMRFVRLRAKRRPDPYNPSDFSEDWSQPDRLVVHGALSSSSSRRTPDRLREQTASGAYLTIADQQADVRLGDCIRADPDDGRLWEVTGIPSRDANAFTGWRPTLEIELSEWKG